MNQARIEQIGTPDEVYRHPVNPFVFNFLGRAVTFRGQVREGRLWFGESSWETRNTEPIIEGPAKVFARPEDIAIANAPNGSPGVEALVEDVNYAGPLVYLELQSRHDGAAFQLEVPSEARAKADLQPGRVVHVNFRKYRVFAEDDSI